MLLKAVSVNVKNGKIYITFYGRPTPTIVKKLMDGGFEKSGNTYIADVNRRSKTVIEQLTKRRTIKQ